MALFRKLTVLAGAAETARRYAKKHPDKVNQLADKAGQFVDRTTKGKYSGKIDTAVRKVHKATGGNGDSPGPKPS